MTANEVKQVWDMRANDPALTKETITFNDYWYRMLEVEKMLEWIQRNGPFKSVLDIGCGNGFTTDKIAKFAEKIHGIDYSEEMIKKAKADFSSGEFKNITWDTGDVLTLNPNELYDLVISSRCLINLISWEDQMKALDNIAACVKPGGIFMMVECTEQGRDTLNDYRENVGLKRIPTIPFNLDFNEPELGRYLADKFYIKTITRFGMYELISKILHPLYVAPEEPKYLDKFNEIAAKVCKEIKCENITGIDRCSHEFIAILVRK